jgi:hypothetical protein
MGTRVSIGVHAIRRAGKDPLLEGELGGVAIGRSSR